MTNRYLSTLTILFHLRCIKGHGSRQFGQMIDFMFVWDCLQFVNCTWDTGSNRCKEERRQQSFRSLAPDLCPECYPRGFSPVLGCLTQGLKEGGGCCSWTRISQRPLGTSLGWPLGLRGSLSILQGLSCCQTTLTQLLRGLPWDLSPSGPKLILQGLHCRSIWSQELFLSWVIKACEVTLWCSLDSDPCPAHSPSSPPQKFSTPGTPVCTPRVGPGCVLWSVLPFLAVSPGIHHVLLILYRQMPVLGGWHHAEPGTQQTGAPPLGTRGIHRDSFTNNVAFHHSAETTGTLSQSHYNWLSGKESTCQHRRRKRPRFNSWVRKIPWRRKWQPTPVFLPGDSHRGAWKATVHGVIESRTRLSTHTL